VGQVEPGHTWDDLVLSADERELLMALSRGLQLRQRLRLQQRQTSGAPAESSTWRVPVLPILFLGPPGTGKTKAARILAAELELPIHELDLDTPTSRSSARPRAVQRAFDRAERDGAILVIDGVGPLLRHSPDPDWHGPAGRGAEDDEPTPESRPDSRTLSIADVLQCAARQEGSVIFTSTVTHGLDPALAEQFDPVVPFRIPEPESRREIWRKFLPADAQLTPGTLDYLSSWLQWSGGAIQRCCHAAADAAAREGVPVQLRHVSSVLDRQPGGGRKRPAAAPPARAGTNRPAADPSARAGTNRPAADPALATPPSPARLKEPPPATSALPRTIRRPWAVAAGGAVACVVVIGLILTVLAGGTSSGSATKHVSAGALRISYPADWRREHASVGSPLGLTGELAVASPAPARGLLIIGMTAAGNTSPLPSTVQSALSSSAGPQIVKVGQVAFYRYLANGAGARGESIYALPTTTGTVVGVCRPSAASSRFMRSCEAVLGTLRLASGKALPVGLNATYARTLNAAIAQLNAVRASAGPQLAAATTTQAQAAAAHRLAQAHVQAASALGHLGAGAASTANAALAQALLTTANAYGALARAAARNDVRGYAAARAALARSAQAISLAFGELRQLGYQVA
jgi:DNA polymerase III delta prime subunit